MKLYLNKTFNLLQEKREKEEIDSYAVCVGIGADSTELFSENVDEYTYFDIASCGKVFVTSPLVLQAIGKRILSLDSKICEFFDGVSEEKRNITVKELLTHTSGIVRIPLTPSIAAKGRDAVANEILSAPLAFKPSTDYVYSCNGMILLGFILEKIYAKPLETIFKENIAAPLGYKRTSFNISLNEPNTVNCSHTETFDDLDSPLDDNNNRVLRTSSGSGGQFSCISDFRKYAEAIMKKDERLYSEYLFDIAESNLSPRKASESRGLGWLYVDEKYRQTGKLFPKGSFGHCGWTGQSIFFNRQKGLYVIIFTDMMRSLYKKAGFVGSGFDPVVWKTREELHNAIYEDLKKEITL